ncbi:type VII secretion protein EccB [Streptomyces lonarensis]|uniref:Type VII secretion protein EccB n=1 Tax=Streptomyces lonarensis TaxID=700599 RepID=A0A7X6HZS1_9ACTN|nr:type VII secretion protein EccB [Streptomyces lonarensis]NJQ06539.1 type VII secretion protein EccB [Streptomyces lonarensis]
MQTKRDQVQAHMFLMGRLTSAMLRSDPDAPESPQARTNRGILWGVVIAIILTAGAFVLGMFSPGKKTSWQTSGDLVVDKDTGARYLYLGDELRPVRNYASARLLSGADIGTTTVGTKSLRDTPRGTPVGIPGAPDQLPQVEDATQTRWLVCAASDAAAEDEEATFTTVVVGGEAEGDGIGADEGGLVSGPDGEEYLVWQGNRLRLDSETGARESLGWTAHAAVPVSASFLNSLPAGPDLTPPPVADLGDAGPAGVGTVGQVFEQAVTGGASRYYQLHADALVPVTSTEVALILGDPEVRESAYGGGTPQALPLASQAVRDLASEDGTANGARLPEAPPTAVPLLEDESLCASVTPEGDGTRISVSVVPNALLGTPAQLSSDLAAPACSPVDALVVPPGGGTLVRAVGAGGGRIGPSLYLVTEAGVKHRVDGDGAAAALGYGSATPGELPAPLLAMVPSGPDLSELDAREGRVTLTEPFCEADDGSVHREQSEETGADQGGSDSGGTVNASGTTPGRGGAGEPGNKETS